MNYLAQNVAKTSFVEQLKLAEKAQEDIYFARVNRELIEALHRRAQTRKDGCRSIGSQLLFNARTPYRKWRETNRPKCFGTSDVYFCGQMECSRRKACEKLVSAWNLEL